MTHDEFFDIGRTAYITGNVKDALAAKQALEAVVDNANSLQQIRSEIYAIATYLECSMYQQFTSEMYVELRERLRKLKKFITSLE